MILYCLGAASLHVQTQTFLLSFWGWDEKITISHVYVLSTELCNINIKININIKSGRRGVGNNSPVSIQSSEKTY